MYGATRMIDRACYNCRQPFWWRRQSTFTHNIQKMCHMTVAVICHADSPHSLPIRNLFSCLARKRFHLFFLASVLLISIYQFTGKGSAISSRHSEKKKYVQAPFLVFQFVTNRALVSFWTPICQLWSFEMIQTPFGTSRYWIEFSICDNLKHQKRCLDVLFFLRV